MRPSVTLVCRLLLGLPMLVSGTAQAQALFPQAGSGQALTQGAISNPRSVQTAGANPASPVTADLGGFWFGLTSAGAGYELGDLNDLVDRAEELDEDLDRENLTQAEAEAIEARAEDFLVELSDKGIVKVIANVQPPFFPMGGSLPFLGGAFTLGANAIVGARIGFLGNDIRAVNTGTQDDCSTDDCEVTSDLSAFARAAGAGVISLGYSGGVLHRPDGSLLAGLRLNHNILELSRGVVRLENENSGSAEDDDELQDRLSDELDLNRVRESALGVDLGLLWASKNFRLGATLRNINEPGFDYPAIGEDCASKTGAAQDNCEAAAGQRAIDPQRVPLKETFVMQRQLQLETGIYNASRTWSLAASYDADAVRDATGDEYQWLSVSGGFSPRGMGWLVPGLRLGYRQNQVGSKLDMVTFGLSLFRVINLDVAASTQKVEEDGDEVPRSAMVNLSFELYF
jgi:hypothetical protein